MQLSNALNKKVVIVTGGTRGIGKSCVEKFLSEGASCVLVARKIKEDLKKKLEKIYTKKKLLFCKEDISKENSARKILNQTLKKFKRVDILINNAAYSNFDKFFKNDIIMYEKTFNTNVKGMFLLLQEVSKHMIKNKIQGSIINLSSQAGRRGEAMSAHYCASKAAVISYTQSSSLELAKHNINVNAVAPGVIDTPLWNFLDTKWGKFENLKKGQKKIKLAKSIPLKRIGSSDEVADLIFFLSSDEAKYITGQTINIDGGNYFN
jgi:D-sorbitol dehydrogenase (acceptor)